jgi:Ca-activated chloride channel family protein
MRQQQLVSRLTLARSLAFGVVLTLAVVWSVAFAQGSAQPDVTEEQSGTLLLKSSQDADPIDAPRVATSIRATVVGNVARVYVTQTFTNPSSDWVEGLYVFPLPAGSAVDELVMHVGEHKLAGEIKEKLVAHEMYEHAKVAGQQASLTDQERPNMFTTQVTNIAPQSSVSIEIGYLETIPCRDSRYTLHLPLAITPRYNPRAGVDPASHNAAQLTRAMNATMGTTLTPERVTSAQQHVDVDVELAPGFALQSVESLHHTITVTQDGVGRHVKLSGSQVPADRDFELVWTPAQLPALQASVFGERVGEETYALTMLSPPTSAGGNVKTDEQREVIFIIDTSGSMFGPSIEQARAALQLGVDRLTTNDRFNVIRFSNDASSLFGAPQAVNETSRVLASRFIGSVQASGGTEMKPALELAFATPPPAGFLRQIVFITDGGVSNEAEIVALIRNRLGEARLFSVGIGAAPNAFFLQEMATAGRGSYTFIADREQVGKRMEDLFRKLEQPALVDLALQWPGGIQPELAVSLPRDVYAGDPIVILARLSSLPSGSLTLSGRRDGQTWQQQLPITFVDGQSGLSKLWARERIGELSRLKSVGGDASALQSQILQIALQYQVVSEYTSLVAVDKTPARPVDEALRSEQAPTSAPVGSYWQTGSTGFAQTATPAPLWMLAGLAAFTLAFTLYTYRRVSARWD